jgi:hypothetical protein
VDFKQLFTDKTPVIFTISMTCFWITASLITLILPGLLNLMAKTRGIETPTGWWIDLSGHLFSISGDLMIILTILIAINYIGYGYNVYTKHRQLSGKLHNNV